MMSKKAHTEEPTPAKKNKKIWNKLEKQNKKSKIFRDNNK